MTKDPYTFLLNYARRRKTAFSPESAIESAALSGHQFNDQRQWGPLFRQAAKDGYIRREGLFPRASSNGSWRPGWIRC
jgi:hypothetical protein